MAIVKSSRAPQPISVSPMRAVRLGQCDALNRWLALADMKTAPELFIRTPLPDDQAMCEIYVSVIEPSRWTPSPVYRLTLAAYHPFVAITNDMDLARYVGSPDHADAPLWVRRLPPQTLLRFPQPLEFVAKLVGGMTNIRVSAMMNDPVDARRMIHWSRAALAITEVLARTNRAPKSIPRRRVHRIFTPLTAMTIFPPPMALNLQNPLSRVPISIDVQAEALQALGDKDPDVKIHSNVVETVPVQTADVSVDTQTLVAGATDAHATMIADVSADMKTSALVPEAADDEDVTMMIAEIRAAWELEEETKNLLFPESKPRRNFVVRPHLGRLTIRK
ncbi:hypothetical protein K438DRAFT_1783119 [Mycena galopus ATCC 62051]|nr:hypothetical protein K438DRAFT_1783119 [Mycena galopus ATCC 62051]